MKTVCHIIAAMQPKQQHIIIYYTRSHSVNLLTSVMTRTGEMYRSYFYSRILNRSTSHIGHPATHTLSLVQRQVT